MLGKGKSLERKLGVFPVTNIVIANIIGAGIFTTTGYLMGFLNNPALMLCLWALGGVVSFCGAIAFSELGAAFPQAGGEYVFISKLFHPLLGFLSGWLSLIVGFSAPIAASAIGFSKYFLWAFPEIQNHLHLTELLSADWFGRILAIVVILVFTGIHSRGLILGTKIQNALTVLKILLVLGLVIVGFSRGKGSFEHINSINNFHLSFKNTRAVGLSLMFIMFAYSGWNSATYIGSEIKNPIKVIPRSLLLSTVVVTLLYVFINLFFVYAVPPSQIKGEPEIAALAADFAFGTRASALISLLVSFALFSSLSAFMLLGPRVYFQMAKDGLFFHSISKISPRFKVPVYSIYLQASIAIILVLSGTFEQILTYMGFSLGIFPVLAVLGVFKLRKQNKSKLKLPGFPVVHIVFIAVSIAMLVLAFIERPWESSIAIGTALSGVPVYYWFKRKQKA